jgi:CMP-N,N'-diacetyllegionaminic acid synthase
MKITIVVPVRAGSERVLNKNTKNFFNSSLLEHKIHVLKKINKELIDNIIVNTNCIEAIAIAKKYNISVHIRDEYFASSNVSNDESWHHIASVTDTENILLAQVTSPFVKASTYELAIKKYKENPQFDSLNSISFEKKFLWKDNKPINYKYENTPKTQNLPDIFSLNFAISLISRHSLLKQKNLVGEKPQFYSLDKLESIDIDDEFDFTFSEILMEKFKSNYY